MPIFGNKKTANAVKLGIRGQAGRKIELRLFENSDKVRSGILNYFDNQISPETATLAMRADFDNADGSLTPGMFGTVAVAGETHKDALLVPERAIGTDLVGRYVMVVDRDSKVAYRHVEVGRLFGKYRIIEKGLSETDATRFSRRCCSSSSSSCCSCRVGGRRSFRLRQSPFR